jgi:hypothetical protein
LVQAEQLELLVLVKQTEDKVRVLFLGLLQPTVVAVVEPPPRLLEHLVLVGEGALFMLTLF